MRPAQQTAATVLGWLNEGRRVAGGLLVGVEGSAPLEPGASIYVDAQGTVEGSVTGGCVESAAAQEAMDLLASGAEPRLVTYGISDELAGSVGLTCGGIVHLFIHELRPESLAAILLGLDALVADRPSAVATVLDGPLAGRKLYVDPETTVGGLGGPELLDRNVEREARGLITQNQTTVRHFGEDGSTLGTGIGVHMNVNGEAPLLLIFGAIDFAAALAKLAGSAGFRVVIADPRHAFLSSPRFSATAETLSAWPQEAIEETGPGPHDAVVVFSHDPKFDVPALMSAFGTDAGYIGALGSRRTTADRRQRLVEAGASEGDLQRLYAPCGLDIGAATVEETAISVLAELTAHRTGRTAMPLRDVTGSIRGVRADGAVTARVLPS